MNQPRDGSIFIPGFLELCTGTEIPPLFAGWSAVAGISCALGRRCWVSMGTFTVYPNMYIVLVGGSGLVRKSTSIDMVARILTSLEPQPNLIAQKITPEALIDALASVEEKNGKRLLAANSTGFVLVDELATFLNKNSYEAGLASLLIPFFDCKDTFDYHTKGGGRTHITNCCLGLLGASTVDWLTNAIPESAIGGGLTSRVVFVYQQTAADPVAIPEWGDAKKLLQGTLAKTLQRITMLSGEFTLSPDATELFKTEYYRFKTSGEGLALFNDKNISGYASRRHVHQLKVGMIISASEGAERVITVQHLLQAMAMIKDTEQHLPALYALMTSTDQGILLSTMLSIIKRNGSIDKSILLRELGHKVGVLEADAIMQTLIAQNRIQMIEENGKTILKYLD